MYLIIDETDTVIGYGSKPIDGIEVYTEDEELLGLIRDYNKTKTIKYVDGKIVIEEDLDKVNKEQKKLLKKNKNSEISSLKVTTDSGKEFDGDETSQDRMLRAIQIAEITGETTTTTWRLADNTDVEVTLDELKEALSLAGKEMSRIWLGN
jgi:hypothetical protein